MVSEVPVYFSSAYLPPLDYMSVLFRVARARDRGLGSSSGAAGGVPRVCLNYGEPYRKQSYRNRAVILGSQGLQRISVPVVHGWGGRVCGDRLRWPSVSSVSIDYSTAWIREHLGAIRSAYGKCAYFAHYYPDIETILLHGWERLVELNHSLLIFIVEAFGFSKGILDSSCEGEGSATGCGGGGSCWFLEGAFDPKRSLVLPDGFPYEPCVRAYIQGFGDRFPFEGGVSVLDLLFNEGGGGVEYLL